MRTSHKFVVLFLLVCLGLQGGIAVQVVEAGETSFGRITADGSTDPDDTATEACLRAVNVTDGENSFSVSCGDTEGGTIRFVTGGNVASASNLDIGEGNFFVITGTTNITNIETTDTYAGRLIALRFVTTLTVDEGGGATNLRMAGNFGATADDTLVLFSFNGTQWTELDRSAN